MQVLMPLALAVSAVVAFNQDYSQDAIALDSRRLQEGKYEKKYRQRCSSIGAFCGSVAGRVAATGKALASKGGLHGVGLVDRVKIAGSEGAANGALVGKMKAGNWGAKRGKAKDERHAKRRAAEQERRNKVYF
ncbi:hypothetical protein LEN26_002263 [Aphanomyces euteiches]|nr:hypothetical protein AeMF1_014131 [Aphanomyces euteiches]KAH9159590.1 hypothetical protein LEN26_002263 [Aphanomyces euteiches]KAH9181146.1 hypothetical protein AeNC1_016878 [Aphanomyces euteiches]